MRLVIMSDSLGLPRLHAAPDERTEYEQVYGHLLRRRLACHAEVDVCYLISLDSDSAASGAEYQIAFRRPDIAILHLGINDCAPRIFRRGKRSVIFRTWFPKAARRMALAFVRRNRAFLTRFVFPGRVYVPVSRFRENLVGIIQTVRSYSPNCRFLALAIAYTRPEIDQRSYGFNANVTRYNQVLSEVFGEGYVDLNRILGGRPTAYLISDGIHLTRQAHAQLADYLYDRILQFEQGSGARTP